MAILPAWVANQNTEFALSSLAMESAIQFIYRACTVITSVLPKSKKKKKFSITVLGWWIVQVLSDRDV